MAKEVAFTGQSGAQWCYRADQLLGTPGSFGGVHPAEGADGAAMAVKVVEKERVAGALDDRLLRREVEVGRRVVDGGADLLLPVLDVAELDDKLLLIMDRADSALAEVALPLDDATTIAVLSDIAAGLQQLHTIGIIHRDLKPPNVLQHAGRWKLADFGIARDEEIGTQDPTFVGWGSSPYMAPELWQMKSPTVKTDLYALGCIGYQLLKGQVPFAGDRDALRTAHLTQTAPDAPTANTALRNLVARLLAKDPGERPQDARAALERLQRAARPLNHAQNAIARGLGAHAAERAQEASRRAAQASAAEARQQQIRQAQADLEEIAADAFEDLQEVEPDAKLHTPDPSKGPFAPGSRSIRIEVNDVRLRVDLWDQGSYGAVPGDTMLLAAAVNITNRRYDRDLLAANLVYEQVGDRLGWRVYRFTVGMVDPRQYPYGPYGRTHGLRHQDFFDRSGRYFMIHPAMHVWQKSVELLTSETMLGLFQEAVELQPPDQRTGLWS